MHLQCLPLLHPALLAYLDPPPLLTRALEVLVASRLNGSSVRDVVRMDSKFSLASECALRRLLVYCFIGLEQGFNICHGFVSAGDALGWERPVTLMSSFLAGRSGCKCLFITGAGSTQRRLRTAVLAPQYSDT